MKENQHDRDVWIGQPLREMLQAQTAAEPSAACLDAETLAAWADDTLAAADRSHAEAHAAGCARCQALLAAMTRTAPAPPVRAWRPMRVMGWLVPLTATAAAALVWMNVGNQRSASPVATVSSSGAAALSEPARDVSAPTGTEAEAAKKVAEAPKEKRDSPSRDARQQSRSTLRSEADQGRAVEQKALSATDRAFADRRRKDEAAAPPPPPSAAPPATTALPAPPAAQGTVVVDALAKSNAAAAGAPPASPRPAAETQGYAGAAAAPKLASSDLAARATVARLTTANARQRVIEATNSRTRWLIAPAGVVQRSTDAGSTWEIQQTGASMTLTAGSAPSASVCWLVGPAGTVLLTTDGQSWRRIAFPEAVDLVSITALNDKTATVTTANGRTFNTVDAGTTWIPSRNP